MTKDTPPELPLPDFQRWLIMVFRYSLGRRTYVTSDCKEWLTQYWDLLQAWQQKQIHDDINDAIGRGNAGDKCDEESWKLVLKLKVKHD